MIVTAFIIFYFFGILQSDYSNNILKPPGNVVKLSDDYSASENSMFNDYLTVVKNLENNGNAIYSVYLRATQHTLLFIKKVFPENPIL